MNIVRLLLFLSAAMIVSGCYTQLALNNDEARATAASEPLVVIEPSPVAIIVEPVFVPVLLPYYPPPAVGVPAPDPVTRPDHAIRDIGNQRGPSGRSDHSETSSRNTGSSRGGR